VSSYHWRCGAGDGHGVARPITSSLSSASSRFYFANRDGKDPGDPELNAGLSTLARDLATHDLQWSVEIPRTRAEFRAAVTKCIEDATGLRAASGE
jgi:hypothetical protein